MARGLLAALALAATSAVLPTPAAAQLRVADQAPAVQRVMNQLRQTCSAQHRRAVFVADFLFSVDADHDGRDDDVLLTAAGFSCERPGHTDGASGGEGHNLCTDAGCMAWLLVKDRGPLRLVWSGRTPQLSWHGDDEGLFVTFNPHCGHDDCGERGMWNGRRFVRLPAR